MNLLELQTRIAATAPSVSKGEWCLISFRPDLGSEQEFIIGAALATQGARIPMVRWLPSLQRLSSLYGEALSISDSVELMKGAEHSVIGSFQGKFSALDTGSPHIRILPRGYIASEDPERELIQLLKRHAGALWHEPNPREKSMDDDWAYAQMRKVLVGLDRRIFVPNRLLQIAGRTLDIGLDSGSAFGNIVSARYGSHATIERHINKSTRQVLIANRLSNRQTPAALFVVLPDLNNDFSSMVLQKTEQLLAEVSDMGIQSFSSDAPDRLAEQLVAWSATTPSY